MVNIYQSHGSVMGKKLWREPILRVGFMDSDAKWQALCRVEPAKGQKMGREGMICEG